MSSYSDYANAVGNILTHQGDVAARAKEQSGQVWGNTLATLGDVVPKEVQQVLKDRAAKQKTLQIQGIVQKYGGDISQAAPEIMQTDPTLGSDLLGKWAKVQDSMAQVDKIKQDAQDRAQQLSDKLLLDIPLDDDQAGPDAFAHWAVVAQKVGLNPPTQFDKTYVKTLQDQVKAAHAKPDEFAYGANVGVYSKNTGLIKTPAPEKPESLPKTDAEMLFDSLNPNSKTQAISQQAVDKKAQEARDAITNKPLTPYETEELKRRDREFGLEQQRLAESIRNHNKVAAQTASSNLAATIVAHPELWNQITPTAKGQLAGTLSEMGFKDFAPKENATMETRLASSKAVLQTGNDIIRQLKDPKMAAQLGPFMSRYNNMADFVGNPPPQFSNLAGLIESYSLANMGVHGMRSANGAEAIKQTLGQNRHTPESMIAAIQGLNGFAQHFMENEGRSVDAGPSGGSGVPVVGGTFQGGKVLKVTPVP